MTILAFVVNYINVYKMLLFDFGIKNYDSNILVFLYQNLLNQLLVLGFF